MPAAVAPMTAVESAAAVMAVVEELREGIASSPDRIGPRYRDSVEAEPARFVDQRRFQRGRIGQKPRSA